MMCEVTLIYKKGKVLNFHKWLYNQTDGLWPEDGKGTGFVEIRPRTDKTEMPRKGEFIGEWSQLDGPKIKRIGSAYTMWIRGS